ncbi:hypothetical protein [Mucilaginibacter sp.]
MIAQTYSTSVNNPDFDIEIGTTTSMIKKAFVNSCAKFVNGISDIKFKYQHNELNENSLTQEFVAHLNRTLRNLDLPICADREYIDLSTIGANTRRTVDFYFYSADEEDETKSIFSVEAKRLPTPGNLREKEYVIGDNLNGGIERFKIEQHGKGLNECAILGFIEENDFKSWFNIINEWISELSINGNWDTKEKLENFKESSAWAESFSIVNRSSNSLKLYHFWINIYPPTINN